MIIKDRLSIAKSYVNVLLKLRERVKSVEELLYDPILRGAVERYLHLSVETLIDIGLRVCSTLSLEKPKRYRM